VWWGISIIPTLERLRQDDLKSRDELMNYFFDVPYSYYCILKSFTARPRLTEKKKKHAGASGSCL
jgi:hypothetical protein